MKDDSSGETSAPPVRVRVTDPHLARLLGRSELRVGAREEQPVEARLTQRQARELFDGIEDRYPPLLTYEQAAELAQVSVSTLKGWFSQGLYANAVRRTKPARVLRDVFIREFMKDRFG
jgi:hypothetical protein